MTADAAEALDRLNQEIRACERCDLYRTATRAVPGEGPVTARIMLVGEAPGFNEDKQGRPFVGAAGKFLEELLAVAGLKRSEVFITNVVKHRPPNNRDPQPPELIACRSWLERQLEIIQPEVIVTLGRFSLGTFFPGRRISAEHGSFLKKDGITFFIMYHPAAALHRSDLKQTLLDDMRKLGHYLQQNPPGSTGTLESGTRRGPDSATPAEHTASAANPATQTEVKPAGRRAVKRSDSPPAWAVEPEAEPVSVEDQAHPEDDEPTQLSLF